MNSISPVGATDHQPCEAGINVSNAKLDGKRWLAQLVKNNESELMLLRVVKRTEPTRDNRLAPKWGWMAEPDERQAFVRADEPIL